jgi:hypothetical protein
MSIVATATLRQLEFWHHGLRFVRHDWAESLVNLSLQMGAAIILSLQCFDLKAAAIHLAQPKWGAPLHVGEPWRLASRQGVQKVFPPCERQIVATRIARYAYFPLLYPPSCESRRMLHFHCFCTRVCARASQKVRQFSMRDRPCLGPGSRLAALDQTRGPRAQFRTGPRTVLRPMWRPRQRHAGKRRVARRPVARVCARFVSDTFASSFFFFFHVSFAI